MVASQSSRRAGGGSPQVEVSVGIAEVKDLLVGHAAGGTSKCERPRDSCGCGAHDRDQVQAHAAVGIRDVDPVVGSDRDEPRVDCVDRDRRVERPVRPIDWIAGRVVC